MGDRKRAVRLVALPVVTWERESSRIFNKIHYPRMHLRKDLARDRSTSYVGVPNMLIAGAANVVAGCDFPDSVFAWGESF